MMTAYARLKQEIKAPVLVVGLGVTGVSVARALQRAEIPFAVNDSRSEAPGAAEVTALGVPVVTGHFDTELFAQAATLVVNPGIALSTPEVAQAMAAGAEVMGDVELFARLVEKPVVAITGSNGKTTVTTLVGEILRGWGKQVAVGGNIGTPALDLLAQDADYFVLELSSFQLETTASLRPTVATILNLSEDHMDRYPSLQAYAEAKQRIYRHCDWAVVNREDEAAKLAPAGSRQIAFGTADPEAAGFTLGKVAGEMQLLCDQQPFLPLKALKLLGRHNQANALAAAALCHALGTPLSVIGETLAQFRGLPHRMQWVAERHGVTWVNDSKGTNVGATLAAIEGIGRGVVLIAGGDGKGADFSPLRGALQRCGRGLVLIGRDAPLIAAAVGDALPQRQVADMAAAVAAADAMSQAGDAVLLSPACASFDMYSGYAQRGEHFMQVVEGLAA